MSRAGKRAVSTMMLVGLSCADPTPSAPPPSPPISAIAAGAVAGNPDDEINPRLLRRFQRVGGEAGEVRPSEEKVALGRVLFHDKRLSRSQDVACSSCHALDNFGIDGRATSTGVQGQRGSRNAPTVFNSATHVAQFWDGRAATVEEQAAGPIMNPREMAMPSEQAVVDVLQSIPGYKPLFERAFPGESAPISLANVGRAIGAFERGLVTRSRWDRFLAGEKAALTGVEKRGLRVFLDVGCVDCHTGPQVGGSMFQKAGAVVPWPNQQDPGRMVVTKSEADRMMFKVPTLKNIAKTAPFFHDGSGGTLGEAVRLMGKHQLGITLADAEADAITAWMQSLTGVADPAYIARPTLPKNGPRTPRPM